MNDHVRNGTFERHVHSIVLGVIMLILGWAGFTLVDLGKTVTELKTQNSYSAVQAAEMKSELKELKGEIKTLRDQVTVAALAAAQAATAAALSAMPKAGRQ